jgi:hypothetical protein
MKIKKFMVQKLLIIIGSFFLICCTGNGKDTEIAGVSKEYYDVAGLIKKQIKLLSKLQPKVEKKVITNGNTESATLDSVDWAKELDIFLQADINKPILKGKYAAVTKNLDNTTFTRYTPKEESDKGVKELIISYSTSDAPDSIKAVVSLDNYLYAFGKELRIYFKPYKDELVISGYAIKGIQKTVLKDSAEIQIEANLNFNE